MKRLLLASLLLLPLSGCYEQSGGSGTDPAAAPAAAPADPATPGKPPTAVPTATLAEEELDSDGDGRIDTWRRSEPDGVIVERRDTDGDGKPDETKRLEPLEEPPPGIGLQLEQMQGQPETPAEPPK